MSEAPAGAERPDQFRDRLVTISLVPQPDAYPLRSTLGYLHSCDDKRFDRVTADIFRGVTRLDPTQFKHVKTLGGAARIGGAIASLTNEEQEGGLVAQRIEAARDRGTRVWGWQAHGDGCDGLPEMDDFAILAELSETVGLAREILPGEHHLIFPSTDQNGSLAVALRVT